MPNKILDAGFVTCFQVHANVIMQIIMQIHDVNHTEANGSMEICECRTTEKHEVHANVIMQIHDVKICDAEPHGGKRLSGDL